MRTNLINLTWALLAILVIPVCARAAAEFSADTVESHPQYGEHKGHLYMGHDRMRTDFEMNGQQFIQIIDLDKQQAIIINPADKSFMRRAAARSDMMKPPPAANDNPCANMQNLVCKDDGPEVIDGRKTHKWEITRAGQTGALVFWLDDQRKIPIRQQMPDGSSMEMRMLGTEVVNGRKTEKWEITSHSGDGQSQTSLQWYDPVLNMNIRVQQPGGFTRNLTNIKLGRQPDSLFSVPAGYTERTAPQQPEK
jgi:hypothetical protein